MYEDIISIRNQNYSHPLYISTIGIQECDNNYSFHEDDATMFCFQYIYEGEGTVKTRFGDFVAKAGDAFWLPSDTTHDYYTNPDSPWKKIVINVKGELVNSSILWYNLKNNYHIKQFNHPAFFEEFIRISKETENNEAKIDKMAVVFLQLVQCLSKHLSEKKIPNNSYHYLAYRIKKTFDLFDLNVSLDTLSSQSFCSKSHYIRTFKKEYGVTPHQYIIKKRIAKAKELLEHDYYTIKEISQLLHFKTPNNFSDFFKKEIGISPTQYRKQNNSRSKN